MSGILIQFDTYCATGCPYCYLGTRKRNKATYGFGRLKGFMDLFQPTNLFLMGGDTFHDREQILDVTKYAVTVDSCVGIGSVSELWKLERDYGLLLEVAELIRSNGKEFGMEFSGDFEGPKTIFGHADTLKKVQDTLKFPELKIKAVVTPAMVMSGKIPEYLERFLEEYKDAGSFIKLHLNFDYEAALYRAEGLEEKAEELFKAIRYTHNIIPFIADSYTGCRLGSQFTIDPDGFLDGCGVTVPENSMGFQQFTALDLDEEGYQRAVEANKRHKKDNDNKFCKECFAKNFCNRCYKQVKTNLDFDGTQAVCQFFKTFESVRNHDSELPYNGFFRW